MIHIDQVRTLELKVKQAVQLIVHLRRENDQLRGRLADTEVRLEELEGLLQSLKASQNEIENGIKNALEQLDNIEDGASAPEVEPDFEPEGVLNEEDDSPVDEVLSVEAAEFVPPASDEEDLDLSQSFDVIEQEKVEEEEEESGQQGLGIF